MRFNPGATQAGAPRRAHTGAHGRMRVAFLAHCVKLFVRKRFLRKSFDAISGA